MNIKQITEQNPNVQLVVNASDLRELLAEWQKETQRQLEHEKAKQQASKSSDGLLTANDVLAMMRISKSMLWKLGKQQKLKPVRIGRRVFFRMADVEAMIAEKK